MPARTVTFDVIQFLTGEAAEKAFREDHPEAGDGPPNGFYIRNLNPRLRTLPVRQHVTARVVWLGGTMGDETIPFEQLPGYVADDSVADRYLWYDPFWLTVHRGRIVSIEEQYLP